MQVEQMGFEDALRFLKQGHAAARSGWNGKGMHIKMQRPDDHSKMTRSYLYMYTVNAELVPWVASQTDLLADDWHLVP